MKKYLKYIVGILFYLLIDSFVSIVFTKLNIDYNNLSLLKKNILLIFLGIFKISCFIFIFYKELKTDYKIYKKEKGKSSPTEILETLAKYNAEGRPIWKPMHMQPIYRMHAFITKEGNGRARTNAYIEGAVEDIGMDIFNRGLCLPSDNKMTREQQDMIIEVIRACFE